MLCPAGTKADLLPDGTRDEDVADWLQVAAAFKKINAVSVHLVRERGVGCGNPLATLPLAPWQQYLRPSLV